MPGKIFFYVRNSKITNPKVLRALFDPEGIGSTSLKDGKYTCEVLEDGRRSLPSNGFFHAILPQIKEALWDLGWKDEILDETDVKNFLKGKFLTKTITNHDTGETVTYVKKTSDLTQQEMNDFLDRIIKFCAQDLFLTIRGRGEQNEFGYF